MDQKLISSRGIGLPTRKLKAFLGEIQYMCALKFCGARQMGQCKNEWTRVTVVYCIKYSS